MVLSQFSLIPKACVRPSQQFINIQEKISLVGQQINSNKYPLLYNFQVRYHIILLRRAMEERSLPSIKDMYNCTRENFDYNVIRSYEGVHKNFAINTKPTKKNHYLDEAIRLDCSPGPANGANVQKEWFKKGGFQSKRAQKETYLDVVEKREKKLNFPAANNYSITMEWPKKRDQLKNISEKINFANTCQYESDKTPGPGTYNVRTHPTKGKSDKKWTPHLPIKPKEIVAAEVATYKPCPLEFNTFYKYQLQKHSSNPNLTKKSPESHGKSSKENHMPGPGTYSTIAFWPGKEPAKKNQNNYFKHISRGPSPGVYHS